MRPEELELAQAASDYGVANTPLFLLRKLKDNPAIRTLSDSCSGQDILNYLRSISEVEPASTQEAVRPYALLTALWFQPRLENLREAALLNFPAFSWYAYIAGVLLETFSPISIENVNVPTLQEPSLSLGSSVPTQIIVVRE